MRSQLFRTQPLAVILSPSVTVVKSLDGVNPVTLFLENMDIAASARTKFGSKNANIRFVAVTAGAGGNSQSVTFHAAAAQAFSIDTSDPYEAVVNLLCDASGKPIQLASEVIDLLNADSGFNARLRAGNALGSDGGATLEVAVGTDVTVDLDGGSAATAGGTVTVEYGPTLDGPWVADSSGGTALSSVSANAVKSYSIVDKPAKAVRVTVGRGAADTKVVLTGVAGRRV